MGFMDKLKETAEKAAQKANEVKDSAMDTYDRMKDANGQKKAERQAYIAEMEEEIKQYSSNLIDSICSGYTLAVGRRSSIA